MGLGKVGTEAKGCSMTLDRPFVIPLRLEGLGEVSVVEILVRLE